MEDKNIYPYLGVSHINDKEYVVLFISENKGLVVMNDTDDENIIFGVIDNFNEKNFDILPSDRCVRLSN